VKGIQVCSNKGPGPLQRGDNHKNVKMGWVKQQQQNFPFNELMGRSNIIFERSLAGLFFFIMIHLSDTRGSVIWLSLKLFEGCLYDEEFLKTFIKKKKKKS
jgi:hypothetical protein